LCGAFFEDGMKKEKRYQINPIVSCGDEEDGAILYNPDIDISSMINLSGRDLWSFLETPHTLAEVAGYLSQSYNNVTVDQAAKDAALFIKTLAPDFLIETANEE
jgi:hypothetical protein